MSEFQIIPNPQRIKIGSVGLNKIKKENEKEIPEKVSKNLDWKERREQKLRENRGF